jgi:hypothetical protein
LLRDDLWGWQNDSSGKTTCLATKKKLHYSQKYNVLKKVPWDAEKNVYSVAIGWNSLWMSKSI